MTKIEIGKKYNCGNTGVWCDLFKENGDYFVVTGYHNNNPEIYQVAFPNGRVELFWKTSIVAESLKEYEAKSVVTTKVVKEINNGVYGKLFIDTNIVPFGSHKSVRLSLCEVDSFVINNDAVAFEKEELEELIETLTQIKDAM